MKELLEQIKQENEEKLLKEKKQKEKTSAEKDKENKQRKESINTTSKSTSVATSVALSIDDYNFPSYLSINPNNNEISEYEINEEKFKKKKTSSPIVEYYNGFEKFWNKEYESPIDLTKSANYVDKKKFISLYELNLKKTKINPKETDVKDKNDKNNKNNKYNNKYNIDDNINNNDYMNMTNYYFKSPEEYYNHYYNYNYNYSEGNSNIPSEGNDIQNIIKNLNNNLASYYSKAFLAKNKKSKKKISGNRPRIGDWTCIYCFNLNFSFRKSCNKCHALKE